MEKCNNYETLPDNVCEVHKFIGNYGNERNYLLYDEKYLGPGYFIINKKDDSIIKFFKLYTIDVDGFPNYYLRAFSIYGRNNPNLEFNNIEFVFRSSEDYENGLFDVFMKFAKGVSGKIETIDSYQQGRNNVLLSLNNEIIRMVVSKDVYRGKQHPTDFIDINFGDNYTCQNYASINSLYNALSMLCPKQAETKDIKKILMLKLR